MTARRALLQLTAGAVLIGLSGLAKARAANGLVALVHTQAAGDDGPVDSMIAALKKLAGEKGFPMRAIYAADAATYGSIFRTLGDAGAAIVVATFNEVAEPIKEVAPSYPNTKFIQLFADPFQPTLPNVVTVGYDYYLGCYLSGLFAARMSKTGRVGYIGGIGVVGFVTPQIMEWDKAHLAGRVQTIDIVDAANRYVPELRPKVDLLIALSHSGISTAERKVGEEEVVGPFYDGLPGVDAVRGTLNGVPAVMPGFWGSHLGVIDLTLAQNGTGWKIAAFTCAARPIAERKNEKIASLAADDPAINGAIAPEHQKTLVWICKPIGHLTHAVNSYFALIGDDASLALVNQAQSWYARPLLANTPAAALPLLSAAAPFKEGYQSPDNFVDLAAGTIAIKDVADLYMYPNTVVAVRVNGDQLREWLERSAEVFSQIDSGNSAPQPLLNSRVPSYVFDVISGVTYMIDITQPSRYGARGVRNDEAHRIVDLRHDGVPVAADQEFIVVTNNYRADSGGVVPKDDPQAFVLRAPDQTRDVIVRYILQHKDVDVVTPPVWSFAPIGKPVSVTFESSPTASRYLLARRDISRLPDTSDGYAAFELKLI